MEPFNYDLKGILCVYFNVSILDFIGTRNDGGGGDSWNYKMNKAPVKLVTTNKPNTQLFTGQMPSCHPTNSVKARKGI